MAFRTVPFAMHRGPIHLLIVEAVSTQCPTTIHSIVGLKHKSARPFFQLGHFFRNAVRDNRVYIEIYYIFDAVISKCPLQPLFRLPKSKVGLTSEDEEAGARKQKRSFLSFYLRGKEKRFCY